MKPQVVLSLFPGIGMLCHAFEAEGFFVARGPDLIFSSLCDVRTYHVPAGIFTGIIGGPPCQSFSSLAHLVRANGHEPKFGNLIPEFERCIAEAEVDWFLMENVRAAPEPVVPGYGVTCFLLDNAALAGDDAFGQEQTRLRKFCFGMRGVERPPDLRRWIDLAVFMLPDALGTTTQWSPDNSAGAKQRVRCTAVNAGHDDPDVSLTAARRETRHEAVSGGHDKPPSVRDARKRQRPVTGNVGGFVDGSPAPGSKRALQGSVTSSDGGESVRMRRYRLADAMRLQGLPLDFLEHSPMTADGKLKAVANGVPIPMGRAIARAVKEAISGHQGEP